MGGFRTSSAVLVATACGLLLWSSLQRSSAEPARSVVTLTLQSVFTSAQDVPTAWVEVLIFSKDPRTIEFFEQPRLRLTSAPKHLVEIRTPDFPTLKMWLLYRIDESVLDQERSMDTDRRRLYEAHKDAAWLFALPVTSTLTEIAIDGANLTYTLTGSSSRRRVTGTAFSAPLPRHGGLRKGGAGYVRVDHLPQVSFDREAAEINRVLPEDLRLNPGNSRIWPGDAALYIAPKTLGGRPYFGPGERDRLGVERGYTPTIIALNTLSEDIIVRREKPWTIVEPTSGQLLTDLSRQDPALWSRLPADVQGRYRAPARIRAGTEARLVALWRRDSDASPRFFVLFIQSPSGEDFRAVLFRLLAANAR